MCTVCGLPTNHSNFVQTLGLLSLLSFGVTTFIGAWWILTIIKAKGWFKPISKIFIKPRK